MISLQTVSKQKRACRESSRVFRLKAPLPENLLWCQTITRVGSRKTKGRSSHSRQGGKVDSRLEQAKAIRVAKEEIILHLPLALSMAWGKVEIKEKGERVVLCTVDTARVSAGTQGTLSGTVPRGRRLKGLGHPAGLAPFQNPLGHNECFACKALGKPWGHSFRSCPVWIHFQVDMLSKRLAAV